MNASADRVSMHAVRRALVAMRAERLGLPLHLVELPSPCPNDLYEDAMLGALAEARDAGVKAVVTCVDPSQVPAELAGRPWDEELLADLPSGADPCGENGEFHTFVSDCPGFRVPIPVVTGPPLERDGFVFSDVPPNRLTTTFVRAT
jgi:diphthamide synthase (EF-2-diphthine--ammonia ligase)